VRLCKNNEANSQVYNASLKHVYTINNIRKITSNLPFKGSRKQFFKFMGLQHLILEEEKDMVNLQIV
jgi:hypothetical protein